MPGRSYNSVCLLRYCYAKWCQRGASMSDGQLLTVREVAHRLKSSEESVRRWIRQGKLRGFRLGGTRLGYRVAEGDLARFIEARAAGEAKGPREGAP